MTYQYLPFLRSIRQLGTWVRIMQYKGENTTPPKPLRFVPLIEQITLRTTLYSIKAEHHQLLSNYLN